MPVCATFPLKLSLLSRTNTRRMCTIILTVVATLTACDTDTNACTVSGVFMSSSKALWRSGRGDPMQAGAVQSSCILHAPAHPLCGLLVAEQWTCVSKPSDSTCCLWTRLSPTSMAAWMHWNASLMRLLQTLCHPKTHTLSRYAMMRAQEVVLWRMEPHLDPPHNEYLVLLTSLLQQRSTSLK